jgi:hypothetical protein
MSRLYLLVTACLTLSVSPSFAAPPSNCAGKFIGTWVYPGGTTVVAPGGIAYPKCPMCVPTQTWTCSGNTYLFSNSGSPGEFSATLSPDGQQLIGGGTVATRVGSSRTPKTPTPTINTLEPGVSAPNVRTKSPRAGTPTITGTEPTVSRQTVR